MEVSTEKSKIMTNSMNNINVDINMNGQKLRGDDQCRVPRATLCKDGTCSAEVRFRIASAMAAMAGLNKIWRCNTISFASKFKLYKSLVTSILFLGCETHTTTERRRKKVHRLVRLEPRNARQRVSD